MTEHTRPKDGLSASAMISELIRAVAIMEPILTQYRDTFDERTPIKPQVGEFYRTYDGSIVQVIKDDDEDNAPMSGLAAALFGGKIRSMGGGDPDDNDAAIKASAQPDESQKPEPYKFAVVVVRGGHGIDNYVGDQPGSTYYVGIDGLTMFGNARLVDETGKPKYDGNISFAFMPLVAMSLKSKLKATFED